MIYDIEGFLTGKAYVYFESAEEAREFARQTKEYINTRQLDVYLGPFKSPFFIKGDFEPLSNYAFGYNTMCNCITFVNYAYILIAPIIPANQLTLQHNFKKDDILAFLDKFQPKTV